MKEYILNDNKYILEKDDDKIFNYEEAKEMITDYFDNFDYIFGDMSYNKIRLKGFCNKNNKNFKTINDIKTLENYIKNFCCDGASWFLLKKM